MIEWRLIPGYENYEVSNTGLIRDARTQRLRTQHMTPLGYYFATLLRPDQKPKMMRVHRAVCMAFLPNPENHPDVNHKDLDKGNNHLDNLEWISTRDNALHACAAGVNYAVFNRNRGWKLSPEDVVAIRARAANETSYQIAKDYPHVSQSHVFNIIKGKKRVRG
jgi:hypothetical protein